MPEELELPVEPVLEEPEFSVEPEEDEPLEEPESPVEPVLSEELEFPEEEPVSVEDDSEEEL